MTISILDSSRINDYLRETNDDISPTSIGRKVVQSNGGFTESEHCDNDFLG